MINQILLLILEAFFGFFVVLLLLRFHMQWLRVSFRNPLGRFVLTLTDRIVVPTRRMVPSAFGFDLSSLLLALLLQAAYLSLTFWLIGYTDQPTEMQMLVYVAVLLVTFTLMRLTAPNEGNYIRNPQ